MGAHRGYRLRSLRGRWIAEIRDRGRYRSQSFAHREDAVAWAKVEAAQVALNRPALGSHLVRGVVLTADLAQRYQDEQIARGRAEGHLREVRRILGELAAGVPRLDRSAADQIEAWLDGLCAPSRGLSPGGRNKYLVQVRALCRWAVRRRLIATDPTVMIERAAVDRPLRASFTIEECRRLIGVAHRARRWIAIMLFAGLRADEALHLRWGDLDRPGGGLIVRLDSGARVKRRKERWVPLQDELVAILGHGRDDHPIAGLSAANPRRDFAQALAVAQVPDDDRSPHSCRHTFAGLMTATGVPSALLSAYLGHTSASTTLGYTQAAARYVPQIEREGWPRGKLWLMPGMGPELPLA
jgi:integrase